MQAPQIGNDGGGGGGHDKGVHGPQKKGQKRRGNNAESALGADGVFNCCVQQVSPKSRCWVNGFWVFAQFTFFFICCCKGSFYTKKQHQSAVTRASGGCIVPFQIFIVGGPKSEYRYARGGYTQ